MDEETATFFTQVDNAIKKLRDGKEDKWAGLSWITKSHPPALPGGRVDGGQGGFLGEHYDGTAL